MANVLKGRTMRKSIRELSECLDDLDLRLMEQAESEGMTAEREPSLPQCSILQQLIKTEGVEP